MLEVRPSLRSRIVGLLGLLMLVASSVGLGMTSVHPQTPPARVVVCSNSPAPAVADASPGDSALVADVATSIVSVTAQGTGATEAGSGIVLRSDGLILTNNHVIAAVAVNGGTITATASDGRQSPATIIGRNPDDDVAVLSAPGLDGVRPALLGSAESLQVGDPVLVVGNALQLPGTVTAGIVSALDRDVTIDVDPPSSGDQDLFGTQPYLPPRLELTGMIQTDASMNEGDSGGALVNGSGAVVGMCTAIKTAADSSGSIGVGFAMPIDVAYHVAEQLLSEPAAPQR